jgi:hypothetical protein
MIIYLEQIQKHEDLPGKNWKHIMTDLEKHVIYHDLPIQKNGKSWQFG